MKKFGYTLLELIIVVVVIGILASIVVPSYWKVRESAWERSAAAKLKAIYSAEKAYRLDTSTYYPASGTITCLTAINSNLSLELVNDPNWNIYVSCVNSNGTCLEAQAVAERNLDGTPGRNLTISTNSVTVNCNDAVETDSYYGTSTTTDACRQTSY